MINVKRKMLIALFRFDTQFQMRANEMYSAFDFEIQNEVKKLLRNKTTK